MCFVGLFPLIKFPQTHSRTRADAKANTPVTLSSNEPECRWNENSLYIPGHSKCILTIRTAFLVHSKYSVPFICYGGGGGHAPKCTDKNKK